MGWQVLILRKNQIYLIDPNQGNCCYNKINKKYNDLIRHKYLFYVNFNQKMFQNIIQIDFQTQKESIETKNSIKCLISTQF